MPRGNSPLAVKEKRISASRITDAHDVAQGGSHFSKKGDLEKMASGAEQGQ